MSEVRAAVRAFLDEGPRFAQLVTVDRSGAPVTRTVGAEVTAGWTVDLLARRGHARLRQLAANPRLQVLFVAAPRTTEPPVRPAVIDYGQPVPRLIALSGRVEPLDVRATRAAYRRQYDAALAKGHDRAPHRSDDEVDADLAGLRMTVRRVRAEGFGDDALAETWNPHDAEEATA